MVMRLSALARRTSTTALIWVGSLTLGLADVLYAGLVPGPRGVIDRAALALACAAGAVLLAALLRGALRYRRAVGPGGRPHRDAIAREAELGIVALEAWLRRQDRSRDG
ncbi:MAG: hypothetical protein ACJ74O_10010 [Frankiaceae bacterium]